MTRCASAFLCDLECHCQGMSKLVLRPYSYIGNSLLQTHLTAIFFPFLIRYVVFSLKVSDYNATLISYNIMRFRVLHFQVLNYRSSIQL